MILRRFGAALDLSPKIDAKTRKVTALATKADGWPFCFPDDVAIDSNGNPCESRMTYVESEVLVKTSSGWKIALGHTTALPKTQK